MQNAGKSFEFHHFFLRLIYMNRILIIINLYKDDANSSNIQIVFETEENKIKQIRFKNDGFPFRPQDWKRLKSIAEGNPDEQKVKF